MILSPGNMRGIVAALGTAQTIAWASSFYIPAVLANPIAEDLDLSPVWVFAAFSMAMLISGFIGPAAGARIDRLGGRGILSASNLVFALGLALLALATGPVLLGLSWAVIGFGMGIGLYDPAFAALARIYGLGARPAITGVTLIAGFASTIGWPLSGWMEAEIGWRGACFVWAALHIAVALPLNLLLPKGEDRGASPKEAGDLGTEPPLRAMILVAFVFTATWFSATAMAAHLPRLLAATGATDAQAIAAGALIGPAQVGARLVEFFLLRKLHPLPLTRMATLTHPIGASLLLMLGAPFAWGFALLHGAGNGILTIAKGTLPLALFGASGYGRRQGLINAPSRILQAGAPLAFGWAIENWGSSAIWLTAGLNLAALGALLLLRRVR